MIPTTAVESTATTMGTTATHGQREGPCVGVKAAMPGPHSNWAGGECLKTAGCKLSPAIYSRGLMYNNSLS